MKINQSSYIQFIKNVFLTLQVYFHCGVYVCPVNSQSPRCEIKTCPSRRKRRSLEKHPRVLRPLNDYYLVERSLENHPRVKRSTPSDPVFGFLPGVTVKYESKVKCKDLDCPLHTKCYELYPARCRADQGFIVSPAINTSLAYSNDTMFRLNGIRFDLVWRSELSDYDDLEFHSLAVRTEGKLLKLIVEELKIEEVVAVKIDAARKGSVVVSVFGSLFY